MARRLTKKHVVMLTTTGVLAGLFIFNKITPSRCYASCAARGASFNVLRQREVTIKVTHPLIASVDIVHLPSNTPTEDRLALGSLTGLGTGLFAVIDGHSSTHCSEHLRHTLLPSLVEQLKKDGIIDKNADLLAAKPYDTASLQHIDLTSSAAVKMDSKAVEKAFKTSFVTLDNNISASALSCARKVSQGGTIKTDDCSNKIWRAASGACALVAMVTNKEVHVANTGDCRIVVGRQGMKGVWSAVPLSRDQNAKNKEEVKRLNDAHPGEEGTVIMGERLLGGLMPLRSFGDVSYKWNAKDQAVIGYTPPNYLTPPYLTAEPVVTSRSVEDRDKFIVMATDGLWDNLSSQQAVDIVGRVRDGGGRGGMISRFLFSKREEDCDCPSENAATALLYEALGGSEAAVNNMLHVPQKLSRLYRDDISVIVIHFK